MMLRGEQLERGAGGAAWLLLRARLIAATFYREIAVGSVALSRLGLITIALGLQTFVFYSPGHFRPAPTVLWAVVVPTCTLAALAVCLLAAMPLQRLIAAPIRTGLCLLTFVGLGILAGYGISYVVSGVSAVADSRPYTNDGAVMDLYAAEQVASGHNPYAQTSIAAALATIDAPAMTVTPLMEGSFRGATAYPSDDAIEQVFLNVQHHQPRTVPPEFESKYNYPAGSILFILPFVLAGVHDMRFLYAFAILLMGCYLAWRLPRAFRPLVPFLVLGNVPLMALTAGGQPDPIYGLMLMVGYAEWRSRSVSAVGMGLAAATKQLAWFFIPFYLLLIARRLGAREMLRRTAMILGIFLVTNGPFIVQSPAGYFNSIAAPMSDPMFPLGIGIIAVFVAHVAPMISKAAFAAGEVLAWIGSLAASWRWRLLLPAAGVVFGALPLFFAWRSLVNYFYLVPLLAVAVIFANGGRPAEA